MPRSKNNRARTDIIIAAIGAVGVVGAAFITYFATRDKQGSQPSVAQSEFKTLERRSWVRLTPDVEVQLKDVETLHGKSKVVNGNFDPNSGIEANRQLDDKEHVVKKVLSKIGRNDDVAQILSKTPAEWNAWLDGLKPEQSDQFKQIPFAKFLVRIDGREQTDLSGQFFFEGESVDIKTGRTPVTFDILKVRNTKAASLEPESVEIRMR